MERVKFVLAFDIATRTGWGMGAPSSQVPTSGAVTLRKPNAPDGTAEHNIAALFHNLINAERPDLCIWETPMTVEAWARQPAGRRQNGGSLIIQNVLCGVLRGRCVAKGIPFVEVARMSVLKAFTGRGTWSSGPGAGDGRENGKREVIDRCHKLGWLPPGSKDDDRADALANWFYASGMYGRAAAPAELTLFNQGKMRHQG